VGSIVLRTPNFARWEHFTLEMLCKDLPANPCREIVAGSFARRLRDNLKRTML
jgi:hypothetical protein